MAAPLVARPGQPSEVNDAIQRARTHWLSTGEVTLLLNSWAGQDDQVQTEAVAGGLQAGCSLGCALAACTQQQTLITHTLSLSLAQPQPGPPPATVVYFQDL